MSPQSALVSPFGTASVISTQNKERRLRRTGRRSQGFKNSRKETISSRSMPESIETLKPFLSWFWKIRNLWSDRSTLIVVKANIKPTLPTQSQQRSWNLVQGSTTWQSQSINWINWWHCKLCGYKTHIIRSQSLEHIRCMHQLAASISLQRHSVLHAMHVVGFEKALPAAKSRTQILEHKSIRQSCLSHVDCWHCNRCYCTTVSYWSWA